jgi:hypothetical protein
VCSFRMMAVGASFGAILVQHTSAMRILQRNTSRQCMHVKLICALRNSICDWYRLSKRHLHGKISHCMDLMSRAIVVLVAQWHTTRQRRGHVTIVNKGNEHLSVSKQLVLPVLVVP